MSYQVIARKYRPQRFDDVVGQRLVTETLKNAIVGDRVAHGYIFSGSRGVGKTTVARILARSLNCAHGPTIEPCGECASCTEVAKGNSIDVIEIDAASNRGIDEIRDLREAVRYLPARDRYKVFIIDEVHMLTTEAFNALLKTLEEPPARSLFILATTEAHKLPATVQSRCQHFAFRLLDYAEIVARLREICVREGVRADDGALGLVAQAGEGSLRDALSLLDEVIAACGTSVEESRVRQLLGLVPAAVLAELVENIHAGSAGRVLETLDRLVSEGHDLAAFSGELTRYTRNLMVAKSCGAASALLQVTDDERRTIERLAETLSEEDITRFFQVLLRALSEMRYSLQPRFNLELALMKLVHAPKLAAIESVLAAVENAGKAPASGRGGEGGIASSAQVGTRQPAVPAASRAPAAPSREPVRTPVPPWKRADSASSAAPAPAPAAPSGDPARAGSPGGGAKPPLRQAAPESPVRTEAAAPEASPAVEDARLAAIKAVLFEQSKFLSSCLNPVAAWRFEDGHVHFMYAKEGAWAADLLKGREHQEKLSAACEKVLGQPVKIHVTLSTEAGGPAAARPSAQQRAERDAAVDALRRRFDCVVVDVKDLSRG